MRLAGLTVKCLSGFHLPGWRESSLQSTGFRRAAAAPVHQLISEQLQIAQRKISSLCLTRCTFSYTHVYIYILISAASSVGRVLYSLCSHNIWTCYEWICTILYQMVGCRDWKNVMHFSWGLAKSGVWQWVGPLINITQNQHIAAALFHNVQHKSSALRL